MRKLTSNRSPTLQPITLLLRGQRRNPSHWRRLPFSLTSHILPACVLLPVAVRNTLDNRNVNSVGQSLNEMVEQQNCHYSFFQISILLRGVTMGRSIQYIRFAYHKQSRRKNTRSWALSKIYVMSSPQFVLVL